MALFSKSIVKSVSAVLQYDISTYEWNGLFEAGDEDGTVWRTEFAGDITENDVPVVVIQSIASKLKMKLASISLYDINSDDEPCDLYVDEDFVYVS